MAPHGTGDGLIGLAALVQVSATLPHNYIAFEYPVGNPAWWYDIVEGLPDPIVQGRLHRCLGPAGAGRRLIARGRAAVPAAKRTKLSLTEASTCRPRVQMFARTARRTHGQHIMYIRCVHWAIQTR